MSTIDTPLVGRITLADLRRASTYVIVIGLVVALAGWASGMSGEQARRRADRIEHERQVVHRVNAVAAGIQEEQSSLDGTRRAAVVAQLGALAAARAAIVADRDAALTSAGTVLSSSAGKVDEGKRAELQAAVDALSAPRRVDSTVVALTGEVARLSGEVTAAEAAWTAEQARRAAEAAATPRSAPVGRTSRTGGASSAAAAGTSVQDVGEAELRTLPGNAGVSIRWDDPGLSGHLGGVWSGNTSYIMVNGSALAGNPGKTRDVVRHEIAHIYQGRLARTSGLTWGELGERMSAAFGANAQEKGADCVAKRFGASWTHYTSDCGGAAKQAWVDGMIGGYLP